MASTEFQERGDGPRPDESALQAGHWHGLPQGTSTITARQVEQPGWKHTTVRSFEEKVEDCG